MGRVMGSTSFLLPSFCVHTSPPGHVPPGPGTGGRQGAPTLGTDGSAGGRAGIRKGIGAGRPDPGMRHRTFPTGAAPEGIGGFRSWCVVRRSACAWSGGAGGNRAGAGEPRKAEPGGVGPGGLGRGWGAPSRGCPQPVGAEGTRRRGVQIPGVAPGGGDVGDSRCTRASITQASSQARADGESAPSANLNSPLLAALAPALGIPAGGGRRVGRRPRTAANAGSQRAAGPSSASCSGSSQPPSSALPPWSAPPPSSPPPSSGPWKRK